MEAPQGTQVAQTVAWPLLRAHLQSLRQRALTGLASAEGVEVGRYQGEIRLLDKLDNLPETLALINQEDRRVAAEDKRR